MSLREFTEKQRALMAACEDAFAKRARVYVTGYFAEHSRATALSLERRGFLSIGCDGALDSYAFIDGQQYSEWLALSQGGRDE